MPIWKSYNSTVLFFMWKLIGSFRLFSDLDYCRLVSFWDDVVRYDFIQIGNQSSKEFVRCDNLLTFDDKQIVHFMYYLICTIRSFIFASLQPLCVVSFFFCWLNKTARLKTSRGRFVRILLKPTTILGTRASFPSGLNYIAADTVVASAILRNFRSCSPTISVISW